MKYLYLSLSFGMLSTTSMAYEFKSIPVEVLRYSNVTKKGNETNQYDLNSFSTNADLIEQLEYWKLPYNVFSTGNSIGAIWSKDQHQLVNIINSDGESMQLALRNDGDKWVRKGNEMTKKYTKLSINAESFAALGEFQRIQKIKAVQGGNPKNTQLIKDKGIILVEAIMKNGKLCLLASSDLISCALDSRFVADLDKVDLPQPIKNAIKAKIADTALSLNDKRLLLKAEGDFVKKLNAQAKSSPALLEESGTTVDSSDSSEATTPLHD